MAQLAGAAVVTIGLLFGTRYIYKRMPKAGSPLFKVGYALYTNTRLGLLYYKNDVRKAYRKYQGEGHSLIEPTVFNGLRILPIAMSLDNYSYLITDERSNISVLVDPSEPNAVQRVLDAERITPTAILCTHKHWDHSGGNREWKRRYDGIRVYGNPVDNVPDHTQDIADNDMLEFGALQFTVYTTPGHTVGHVVFLLEGSPFSAPPCLFSGDHIFLAGAGRMFESTPATMLNSLEKVLQLSDDTLIWPGHEYAEDNLQFACHLEPNNRSAQEKLQLVKDLRKSRKCTSPSTLAEEKTYNPFLRVTEASMMAAVGTDKSDLSADELHAETLQQCRNMKDKFKYKL
ncbi:hypothetical protein LSH36_281g10074 [Paralvinella palmiformis]|uniref:Metallo-beta-lactamase domain-containing protein n=1 Tax=Paralvinella palmiformis TaxID=53620 RepID=A0AAD9JIS8_9ANNE|nr:hypothetical protein LSH36_281g10074 [Paralvinella palmiformis]